MADAAASGDPLARYDAVERAYCDGQWDTVLQHGGELLASLADAGDAMARGLRPRLQLLLAHTHLHGRGDAGAAREAYRAALADDPEPSLRGIAEEGLRQCAAPAAAAGPRPETPPAKGPDAGPLTTAAAAPWLEAAPLIPEVVEEPELIEVHQADPALAENLDLSLNPSPGPAPGAGTEPRRADAGAAETPGDAELRQGLLRVVLG